MGLQVFHFHTTGYEIDMKQKKVWKKYFFNKTKRMEIFNKDGRVLKPGEKAKLVEAEYERILPQLSRDLGIVPTDQEKSHSETQTQPPSLHQSLGLAEKCLKNSQDQMNENLQKNSNASNSSLRNINWDGLRQVVETISRLAPNAGSIQETTQPSSGSKKRPHIKGNKTDLS